MSLHLQFYTIDLDMMLLEKHYIIFYKYNDKNNSFPNDLNK